MHDDEFKVQIKYKFIKNPKIRNRNVLTAIYRHEINLIFIKFSLIIKFE